jgi:hypothetical protein
MAEFKIYQKAAILDFGKEDAITKGQGWVETYELGIVMGKYGAIYVGLLGWRLVDYLRIYSDFFLRDLIT